MCGPNPTTETGYAIRGWDSLRGLRRFALACDESNPGCLIYRGFESQRSY